MTRVQRSRLLAVVVAVVTVVTGGCATRASHRPTAQQPPPATPPASPTPTATQAPVTYDGNARTNPACALASVNEIEQITGATVRDLLGLTSSGSFSKTMYSCTWHLAATDIAIPAVVIQYELMGPHGPGQEAPYLRSLIRTHRMQGAAQLGDVAGIERFTLDLVDQHLLLHVHVQLHADPTPEQNQMIVALTRLVLPRAPLHS